MRVPNPPPFPPCTTHRDFFGKLIETKESKSKRRRYKLKLKLWELINEDKIKS